MDHAPEAAPPPLAACGICGIPSGTERCDRCWELEQRIQADLRLAFRIFTRLLVGMAARGEPLDAGDDLFLDEAACLGEERACRVCGCTELNCSGCIERTGEPCFWVEADLCSACAGMPFVWSLQHQGDPCIFCGLAAAEVEPGPCRATPEAIHSRIGALVDMADLAAEKLGSEAAIEFRRLIEQSKKARQVQEVLSRMMRRGYLHGAS